MADRNQKFEVGQEVKLTTISPTMKISIIHDSPMWDTSSSKRRLVREFNGNYTCQWFNGTELKDGIFPEESLIKV